ncbi:MAG: Carbon monoxide dehydrogenase medium chain [Syntrophorhabdaceae bacterium PtaU1.Bin034]|nr:MAG: Carbon monoxide dehydrogenase medium chain [Syntrophorhabdaceae bacterium PtaU1.Bin034]
MALPRFDYVTAHSLEEAGNLAAELGDKCVVLAGGTDVIVAMKDRLRKPEHVLDIKRIPGIDRLEYVPGEGLKIGALTTLRTIETSKIVKAKFSALADAAHYVASVQVRARGTMAGNICNASPSADTAPILIVLNATVKTFRISPDQGRTIPIGEFFRGVGKTVLASGEIVTEIGIPDMLAGECAAYLKHSVRKAMDLAIVGVAAWLKMDGRKCVDCRIALGAVAPTPIRTAKAEKILIGRKLTDELIEQAGVAASDDCSPISDIRASAEYRCDMVRVFTKRAIKRALETNKA